MPTLRCILKYTPAVLLGLLVVAWVASWVRGASIGTEIRDWHFTVIVACSTIDFWIDKDTDTRLLISSPTDFTGDIDEESYLGRCAFRRITLPFLGGPFVAVIVALPLLVTIALPLAIGPFISFRFRLWHYLAYTALVAVELAYYLRWQE